MNGAAKPVPQPKILSETSAIAIARKAIEGKVTPQPNAPVNVELTGNHYVVTFGHINPPATEGPDFDARVTLDATTGKVTHILGGP